LWLDRIPIGIGGDELTYVFNAKAIFLTGSDISGTWNPMSAFYFPLPSLYHAPSRVALFVADAGGRTAAILAPKRQNYFRFLKRPNGNIYLLNC